MNNEICIQGWSKKEVVANEVYDNLINSRLDATTLVLKGRGLWDSCHCPAQQSKFGEQFDPIVPNNITNLESIYVTSTFSISSCALLNLIARSPKLKTLKFMGNLIDHDHAEKFLSSRFLSNLDSLHWPWARTRDLSTIKILVKRNENITTLYTNSVTVCDLLAAETLPNLRYLSLNMNDRWLSNPESLKRGYRAIENMKYLATAKNVEALEIRSFSVCEVEPSSKKKVEIERIHESYVITFWEQVSKLPKLVFLAVYGSWELERICREMSKHSLQIELLKINLMPNSVIAANENRDDNPTFSMVDGIRNIRKLSRLRSLHLICYEKLGTIDEKTTSAMKEILDLFWNIEIKVNFTPEVEDFMNILMRRANQLGKLFNLNLHIQTRSTKTEEYADLLVEKKLRFPLGTNLRERLASIAEDETKSRFNKPFFENFQIWGIEQTDNFRDRQKFEELSSKWKLYNQKFEVEARFT